MNSTVRAAVSRKRGLSVTEKRLEEERRAATERQPYQRRPKTPSKRPKLSKAQQADKTAAAAVAYWNGTLLPALQQAPAAEQTALTKSLFKLVWERAGEVEARAAVASLCEPPQEAVAPAPAAKKAKRSTSPEVQIPFSGRWRLKSDGREIGEFDLDGEELFLADSANECYLSQKATKAADKFDFKFKGVAFEREGQRVGKRALSRQALGRDERAARGGLAELRGAARRAPILEDGQHRLLGKQGHRVFRASGVGVRGSAFRVRVFSDGLIPRDGSRRDGHGLVSPRGLGRDPEAGAQAHDRALHRVDSDVPIGAHELGERRGRAVEQLDRQVRGDEHVPIGRVQQVQGCLPEGERARAQLAHRRPPPSRVQFWRSARSSKAGTAGERRSVLEKNVGSRHAAVFHP